MKWCHKSSARYLTFRRSQPATNRARANVRPKDPNEWKTLLLRKHVKRQGFAMNSFPLISHWRRRNVAFMSIYFLKIIWSVTMRQCLHLHWLFKRNDCCWRFHCAPAQPANRKPFRWFAEIRYFWRGKPKRRFSFIKIDFYFTFWFLLCFAVFYCFVVFAFTNSIWLLQSAESKHFDLGNKRLFDLVSRDGRLLPGVCLWRAINFDHKFNQAMTQEILIFWKTDQK